MRKFLIDTDAGIDDSIAIMMAAAFPEIEIRAITTVFGTSTLAHTTQNVCDICSLIHLDVPVAAGAAKAIAKPERPEDPQGFHGANGVGDVALPKGEIKPCKASAWDILKQQADQCQGELEVVTLGPLTNLAIALLKYPDLGEKIKRLVIMGGSAKTGNVSAHAEANIFGDPIAAEMVFQSGIARMEMIGLNATEQCRLTTRETNHLFSLKTIVHPFLDKMLETYKNSQNKNGEPGMLINDGVAMAVAIDPDCAQLRKYPVACETAGSQQGRTVIDFRPFSDQLPNVHVAMSVDKGRYIQLLSDTINYLKK